MTRPTRPVWMLLAVSMAVAVGCASEPTTAEVAAPSQPAPGASAASATPAAPGAAATPSPIPSKPSGLLIEPVDALNIGYSIQWATTIDLPAGSAPAHVAVLGDLLVVLERPDNIVHAISLKNGKQLWRTAIGGKYDRFFAPVRVDDSILINSEAHLYRLRAGDGRLTERADLKAAVNSSPAMIGEIAVFGGSDGTIFGHDTRVGYSKWVYRMPGQVVAQPRSQASSVFVGCVDGQYAMFAGRSGDLLFRGRTFAKISAPAAINSQGIFLACEDHSLYALNRSTGEDRWIFRYTDALTESPVALGNNVYQPLPSGELVALKSTDGAEQWRIKTTDKLITQTGLSLVFNGGDKIVLRDARTGKEIGGTRTTESLHDLVALEDASMILVTAKGRFLKVSPVK